MLLQLPQVFLGGVGAVHFLELPIHPQAVDSDGVRLVDFRFQGGDVLVFHIGIEGKGFSSKMSIEFNVSAVSLSSVKFSNL